MSKSRLSIKIGLLALSANMLLLPDIGFAEMYKWTDEEGVIHYTQQPPPGEIEVTKIATPSSATNADKAIRELDADKEKLNKLQETRKQERKKQAEEARIAAVSEENCRKSKGRLTSLQSSGRVRALDADGNVTRITEEEHQARIDDAKSNIEKYCK